MAHYVQIYDVIHKTANTERITTPPEKNRATMTGNTQKEIGEGL